MSPKTYNNFDQWVEAHCNDIFRMWEYKKMFTPYEQEQKFIDESIYVDSHCSFIIIKEVIHISSNKIMIGVRHIYDFTKSEIEESNPQLSYYMLDEIKLDLYPEDSIEIDNDLNES